MYDLHMHTTYSDGINTPEEMVKKAISLGMSAIGLSDHSYTDFDPGYCMHFEAYPRYLEELSGLKEKYSGRIKILTGIEQDYFSPAIQESLMRRIDYVIGSVHYVYKDGGYFPVDDTKEAILNALRTHFNNNIYDFMASYFETVKDIVKKTGCRIIGHFDLIMKFNEKGELFNPASEIYRQQWQDAAAGLIKYGVPFELNTGAISRGYRSAPYPAFEIIEFIKKNGGSFILSSDAHSADNIMFKFSEYKKLIS